MPPRSSAVAPKHDILKDQTDHLSVYGVTIAIQHFGVPITPDLQTGLL